jgi:predicted flap endonuclease-1-like 5' DNA nuclease
MNDLLVDPIFYCLVWAAFTVAGAVLGWSLRANFPEQDVRRAFDRSEHDRSVLARLYTHIKHQHDLREADFKRATLELDNLREHLTVLDQERVALANTEQMSAIRIEQAEANAARFAERFRTLEEQTNGLRARNTQLSLELGRMQTELNAWKTLYRDFQTMQQKLHIFEQTSAALETERNTLRQQLETARADIERLQAAQPGKRSPASRKGGLARSSPGPDNPDDLKIIKGIALATEQQLHGLGIFTYVQMSHWDDDAIISAAKKLGISPGKIYQDDWVGQARQLAGEERV